MAKIRQKKGIGSQQGVASVDTISSHGINPNNCPILEEVIMIRKMLTKEEAKIIRIFLTHILTRAVKMHSKSLSYARRKPQVAGDKEILTYHSNLVSCIKWINWLVDHIDFTKSGTSDELEAALSLISTSW